MDIKKEDLTEIIEALEEATGGVHSEYCYSGHCSCRFDLIEKWTAALQSHNS